MCFLLPYGQRLSVGPAVVSQVACPQFSGHGPWKWFPRFPGQDFSHRIVQLLLQDQIIADPHALQRLGLRSLYCSWSFFWLDFI